MGPRSATLAVSVAFFAQEFLIYVIVIGGELGRLRDSQQDC